MYRYICEYCIRTILTLKLFSFYYTGKLAERQGKVFAQAFFKKLAVGKAEPYGLDLALKWASAREELGKQRSAFPGR